MKADLVDILKEIGRLTKQQKDTNRKLDDINRKFDLVCKLLMKEDTALDKGRKEDNNECESEQP